jgi:hypothetical protein
VKGTVIVKLKHQNSEAELVVEFTAAEPTVRIVNHSTDEIEILEVFQNWKGSAS